MTPHYTDPLVTLYLGDCLDVMRELPDASVDSVVTDPPYQISFMGKTWDANHQHEPWSREAFRVLKPGGCLLAFGGTRTYHRLASAIEDAGFEIRDTLMWIYASGFPKSLDVSKALDKVAPRAGQFEAFAAHLRERRIASGQKQKDVAQHFPSKTGGLTGCVANWELGYNVPTVKQWAILQPMLDLSDDWLPLIERIEAEREKVGEKALTKMNPYAFEEGRAGVVDITAPATDLARKWEGWGTALKPAHEPIVMARKPLVGTVAANVTRYGTGALNIDGTRIGTGGDKGHWPVTDRAVGTTFTQVVGPGETRQEVGRWPSNVLLSDPELFDEPNPWVVGSGATTTSGSRAGEYDGSGAWSGPFGPVGRDIEGDAGGYSRFFLIPKADRAERERGLDAMPNADTTAMVPAGGSIVFRCLDCQRTHPGMDRHTRKECARCGSTNLGVTPAAMDGTGRGKHPSRSNVHPTVKPIDLMRHLVRLVTPPGGVTLDPFLGSGTTALAASEEGFRCIGIEREAEYLDIAVGRLMATPMGLGLDVPGECTTTEEPRPPSG